MGYTTQHEKGLFQKREWYSADIYGEDGRAAQEPQRITSLTSEEVLRLVVMPDEQGRYHFDEMGMEHLASIPGVSHRRAFLAHLPPTKQSVTGKHKPNKNIFVGAYQPSMTRDGKQTRPSLRKQEHAADHHRQTQAHHHS
jgi:hypothetical protein